MPPRRSNSRALPPLLPTEILLAVFSFCSPRTLATVSRCSHEFLALAGPILYRTIRIDELHQLVSLFSRKAPPPSGVAKLNSTFKSLWSGGQAPTLPFAPPLPSPLLLPYLSLSQITHLHLLLPIHTPPHDPPLPYTRLLNSGSSTLNLDTLTLTSSLNIAMNTQNTVWSYLRAKHLILYLLPAEEEESAEAGPGGCYLRKVDPPLVSLGLEEVTTIVVIDLARATPVPWRLERLFGRPSSARASANGAVPTIRFIFHTRDGRGGFGRKVLSDFLAQMQTLDALPGTASWGGRTVLDVGSEAEADEVRLWAEGQEEAKGKSVVTDLRVVVRESKVGWAGGLKSGAWGKKKPKVESIRSVSRVGSFVGSFR